MDCKVDRALHDCFIHFFFKDPLFVHGKERPLVNISLGAYRDYFKALARIRLAQGGKCYLCLRYCKPAASGSNSYSLHHHHHHHFLILRNDWPYASIVLSASSSVCAYDTKQVSN